jgi:OOP family OmpA-OmpF porin
MKRAVIIGSRHLICSLAAVAAVLPARGQGSGFYFKTDAGGNITQSANLTEFFGPVAPGTKVKFDAGFTAGITGGYQVTDWFAAEAEIGFMQNRISSITGADVVQNAWYVNVPFLINAKLQYPNSSPLTPYIGAGVGFSEALIDVDQVFLNGTSLHGSIGDTVFAWQALAGLRYRLNERMGLSVEYRYFVADGPSWRVDATSGTATDTMRMGHTQTHAFSLAFDLHF